jgi:type IV secretion system protein VirB5
MKHVVEIENIKSTPVKLKAIALALTISLAVPTTQVNASGFPTVDILASIQRGLEYVEQAARFKKEIEAWKNEINEMKRQGDHYKSMVEGHFDFEDILNDPYVSAFMQRENWEDGDISEMRNQYGMKSDNPQLQRNYDNILRQQKIQEDMYGVSVKRSERMSGLLNQFDSAETPAAKADIANSLRFEQVQMQNDTQMMEHLIATMERQRLLDKGARMRELQRKLLGDGIPPPAKRPLSDYL